MGLTNSHSEYRVRKRQGISKKCVDKKIREVLEFGIHKNETSGQLRRYLNKQSYGRFGHLVVYKGFLYIFMGDCLVTTYSLPHNLMKIETELRRKRELL